MQPAVEVPINELHPHPRNYRAHPDDQLDQIAHSLRLHGVYRNVVVARDNTILAGHGVVAAARRLGWESIPIVRVNLEPDDPRALKLLVGDNELSNLGEIDDRALTDMLRQILQEAEDGLAGTGYDEAQLAALALYTRTAAELPDFAAAAEWVGMPEFDPIDARPQLVISFDSTDERQRFLDEYGFEPHRTGENHLSWSMRWPPQPRRDLAAVEYQ